MTAEAKTRGFAAGLRLVSASAGSGKTYRLTEEVTSAVVPPDSTPIEIDGLVAVTYTTKAQAELEARIRRVLADKGASERGQQLPLAYLGTVHSVCLRLLKEFALDAGLSPAVDVIPGSEGRRLLQAALERELDPALRSRIQELALGLQLNWDGRTSRVDWVTPVDDIMTLARGNRIRPEQLPSMAQRSVRGLFELLPAPASDGESLERGLGSALDIAIKDLSTLTDGQRNTAEALKVLRAGASSLRAGRLHWGAWAKLCKVTPGRHGLSMVASVHDAAGAYERHPEFHTQVRELTESLFEAARVGLIAYADWKARRGLVDYVDMIDRALDVLDVPEVADELRARLALVVVDEFQDTSPIQLALFTRLHELCKNSVWVGDRKQCIFEYAGADPALMEAVTNWATQSGGKREFLTHNYRSRPELVSVTSTLFSTVFAEHDYTFEEVVTTAKRKPLPELEALPPVGLWWLNGQEHAALADGVARLLQRPNATPVVDRISGQARSVRPGDIAVLVYSNADAEKVSSELKARGVDTVLPRVGLIRTPEGTLVSAALRVLVDPRDTLAAAEIDALTGYDGRTADEWLTERMRTERARKESAEKAVADAENDASGEDASWVQPGASWTTAIARLRGELSVLSPTEVLDRVLSALDVPSIAVRWPDPEQRLGNLDALRALAAAYEERCAYQREAASLPGLLRYFEETQQEIRQRDEERATDEQHVSSTAAAVVISTYHKAKGLEWPVVVLGGLDRKRKRDAFDVAPETERQIFDASDPLGSRWIRYWPWPFGAQQDVPLAERAAQSAVGRAIVDRDSRERARLLYVGFTRARDHLVLGIRLSKQGPRTTWLDELNDNAGPVLTLPAPSDVESSLGIRGPSGSRLEVPVRAWSLDGDQELVDTAESAEPRFWFARSAKLTANAPTYYIAPSSAATESLTLGELRVASTTRFTSRMPFSSAHGTDWDHVGTTLHAFLAADYPELGRVERAELAQRILGRAGLDSSFTADALLRAGDALRKFIAERWPNAIWHREIPVLAALETEHGSRRIAGSIDLLLETPAGFVIIDHKSFPGAASHWESRAIEYAPQLATYSRAIEMAGGEVIGRFVHFTVGGGMAELVALRGHRFLGA